MTNFKPTKKRSSLLSNEVIEKHRYNLSLNGQKVLFGLAQSIDHTIDLFGELEIDIRAFFKYLDIENRNDRYEIIRDAFFDILNHPLQYSTGNAKRWSGVPWLSVDFNADESNYVKIQFTEKAKPFLLQLNGYVKIQGKHITSLQSRYATWLYPVMKMIQGKYYGQHVIPITRLMELTFTDNKKEHPAYHGTYGTSNFLRKVIGLKKNRESKEFEIIEGSPLDNINKETDLIVSAEVLKSGRSYDRIAFLVSSKKKTGEKSIQKYATVKQEKLPNRIPMKQVYELSKATGKTVSEILKESKRTISKDGKWAIRANDEWVQDQRKKTLFNQAIID